MARLHRLKTPWKSFCIIFTFHIQIFSMVFLYIRKELIFKQWTMGKMKRQSSLSFLCGIADNHHFSHGYYSNLASLAATFFGTLKKKNYLNSVPWYTESLASWYPWECVSVTTILVICSYLVFNLLVSSCTGRSRCDVPRSCCRHFNQRKC